MRDPAHYEYKVDRTLASDLIRDGGSTAVHIMGFRDPNLYRRLGRHGSHGSYEPVATAMTCLHKAWIVHIIIQSFSNFENLHRQRMVGDENIRPKRLKKLLSSDYLARALGEVNQHVQCLGRHLDRFFAAPELLVRKIQSERPETKRSCHSLQFTAPD